MRVLLIYLSLFGLPRMITRLCLKLRQMLNLISFIHFIAFFFGCYYIMLYICSVIKNKQTRSGGNTINTATKTWKQLEF